MALGTLVAKTVRRCCHSRTDCRPVFYQPDFHPLQIFQEPIVIERHGTYDVRPARKCDDPYPVVRPAFDEFTRYLSDRIDPGRLFASDLEILRQHRARYVEGEHDIDSARFDSR